MRNGKTDKQNKARKVNLQSTLEMLASEHLERMVAVGWHELAEALNNNGHGETFGCEVDGVYCDVGDSFRWEGCAGGPIRLNAHATAQGQTVERSRVLRENSN